MTRTRTIQYHTPRSDLRELERVILDEMDALSGKRARVDEAEQAGDESPVGGEQLVEHDCAPLSPVGMAAVTWIDEWLKGNVERDAIIVELLKRFAPDTSSEPTE